MKTQDFLFQSLSLKDLSEILRIVLNIQQYQVPGFFWNESDLRAELQVAKAFGCFYSPLSSELKSEALSSSLEVQQSSSLRSFLFARVVDEKIWDITLLGVDPAFWGQGMMKFVLQTWLQSLSTPCEIWLEVHSQNQQAMTFYLKQGFLVTGRRANYYRDGGDALLMVLKRT